MAWGRGRGQGRQGARWAGVVALLWVGLVACDGGDGSPDPATRGDAGTAPGDAEAADGASDALEANDGGGRRYTETRQPCTEWTADRRALWGDLHVHTAYSFDARAYGTVVTPDEAYAFASGAEVLLAPLGPDGRGTRALRLQRPLDFLALTDHGELLGEVARCTEPDAETYHSARCERYRDEASNGAFEFALPLSQAQPRRFRDLCGEARMSCEDDARRRWVALQEAAERAYDRSAACTLTTFVGYEYTNTTAVSNLHRNVVFRNAVVPDLPITHFEAPTPLSLWRQLDVECGGGPGACDVLVLPHNSNLSNGQLFAPEYGPDAQTLAAQAEVARLRARLEPVVEIFQHKGDSECRRGLSGYGATDDPACDFEKLRAVDAEDCGDAPGTGGMRLWGCVHRLDFVRNVFKAGLLERARLGVNPYFLGVIGSTDTHNGAPGYVDDRAFQGHVGVVDDTAARRLGAGTATHDALINNPGGLAGVWAEENSRDAIFEAIRRRETFATSGPRVEVRFFGGWGFSAGDGLCGAPDRVAQARREGVPMGSELPAAPEGAGAPWFWVQAEADPGPPGQPGAGLSRLEVIKVWLDADGEARERVFVVDTAPDDGDSVNDEAPCGEVNEGAQRLCRVWQDPEFSPAEPAIYYARALEVPTCRWSARECDALPAAVDRPPGCDDPRVPRRHRHRAWSSPIGGWPGTSDGR